MLYNIFTRYPIPKIIPKELEEIIQKNSKDTNKRQFLEKSFTYIVHTWGGHRYLIFPYIYRILETNLEKIMHTSGYIHCTTMNYLLRVILIKSGRFTESDIELKMTHTWYIFPHQYMKIRVDNKEYIDIDPWNYQFGIPFGKHGTGFDSVRILSQK